MPVRQCNRQLSMKQPKCVTWLKCSGHEIANTFLDFPQVYTLSPQVRDWRKVRLEDFGLQWRELAAMRPCWA